MTALFLSIVNMSITASIAAVAVMLMRIPLKKAPKIFSYALWGVVIFRLVFPFSVQSIFSLMPSYANVLPQAATFVQNPIQPAYSAANAIGDTTATALIQTGAVSTITALDIVSYIWLAGFLILLAHAVKGYVDLRRRVRFATLIYDNVYESDQIKTPFVLGFIRPQIYFPTAIDPSRHDYILMHEQIHIKRRDYLIKPFSYIVFAMHWFNPIMWMAYFLMSKDMEMSCDESVLRRIDQDIRRDYSMSLLCLSVKRVSLLNPIAFASGESNVKERVTNVLGYKKSARLVSVALVFIVGVFMVGFSSDSFSSDGFSSEGITPATAVNINMDNWYTYSNGAVIAPVEDAQETATHFFSRYFSAFSEDWGNFNEFHMAAYPGIFDSRGISNPIVGRAYLADSEHRDFVPPLIFFVCMETGATEQVRYSPPLTNHIATDIAPFEMTLAQAYAIYGSGWWGWGLDTPLPLEKNSAYINMLIDYSMGLVADMNNTSSTVLYTEISMGASFANGFVNTNIYVSFACGKHITISYRVHDEFFVIGGISITWRN